MKRTKNLIKQIVSDENLDRAITEVNKTHHWHTHHRPNRCTAWVEETREERKKELRDIILRGFEPAPPKVTRRWDASAQKYRIVSEPKQWPDQYVHHALIQVLEPIFMRGMDPYCCGSIRGRGASYGRDAIKRWMKKDKRGTKYGLAGDIRHFYDSLTPDIVMARMKQLINDERTLDLIERIIHDGILIGAYTSQWFANVTLQPLDQLIRSKHQSAHYIRYIDNLTLFGANRRDLHKLRRTIQEWLNAHDMTLKGDWQVYRIGGDEKRVELAPPRKGVRRPKRRLPDALGYRYGRGWSIPRKRNLLRTKRQIHRLRWRIQHHKRIMPGMAMSLMSRLGQLKHCNNYSLYRILFNGEKIVRLLRRVLRENSRKEKMTWSTYLELRASRRLSAQRALSKAA